jgi:hypothetical protein
MFEKAVHACVFGWVEIPSFRMIMGGELFFLLDLRCEREKMTNQPFVFAKPKLGAFYG